MDFTREPIIETVITPKEGCKLVVRSSNTSGQEEFFVDAVQVVSFGHSLFFRSLERPKTFLVPVSDYEIVEVREPRMVLKNVGIDRSIKIAGGREGSMRSPQREHSVEQPRQKAEPEAISVPAAEVAGVPANDLANDKRRDRRRNVRRRRGRDEVGDGLNGSEEGSARDASLSDEGKGPESSSLAQQVVTTSILNALLPPPPRLISETIAQYRDTYKDAFYSKEEQKRPVSSEEPEAKPSVPLSQPEYGSYEMTPEEEENIYQQRKKQGFFPENESLSSTPQSIEHHEEHTPDPEQHL